MRQRAQKFQLSLYTRPSAAMRRAIWRGVAVVGHRCGPTGAARVAAQRAVLDEPGDGGVLDMHAAVGQPAPQFRRRAESARGHGRSLVVGQPVEVFSRTKLRSPQTCGPTRLEEWKHDHAVGLIEESQFDAINHCLNGLGCKTVIEQFNGGIDVLLAP